MLIIYNMKLKEAKKLGYVCICKFVDSIGNPCCGSQSNCCIFCANISGMRGVPYRGDSIELLSFNAFFSELVWFF